MCPLINNQNQILFRFIISVKTYSSEGGIRKTSSSMYSIETAKIFCFCLISKKKFIRDIEWRNLNLKETKSNRKNFIFGKIKLICKLFAKKNNPGDFIKVY